MSVIPHIDGTCFGEITVGENTYQKDIYILTNGTVTKRKKAIAREAYGTSHKIGSLESDLARGFELSLLSVLGSPGAAKWWNEARITFNSSFADHVDAWLARAETGGTHPSLGVDLK